MEEDTHATVEEVEVKLNNKVDIMEHEDEREVLINGDSPKKLEEGSKKEYEEETALDGEFIRVEKELIDVKESSKPDKRLSESEATSGASKVSNIDFSELEDKIKSLELQVEHVAKELQQSESEKAMLKSEVDLAKGKLEEMERYYDERSSHAELESQRALEFENMLKVEKLGAKELEGKHGNLQEELSVVQEKLDLSKSQAADLEQKLVSQEGTIQEFIQELNVKKISEEQMREDVRALENLLSASREDLQAKTANMEEVELKFQEEIKARQIIEASLKNQEKQTLSLHEELEKLAGEKEALQSSVADLNTNLSITKDLCSQLEAKLNLADQNFGRTDSLLSQALSDNEELDRKLKSFEELHHEYRTVAETSSQRNLELEGLVHTSNAAEEEVKTQLREAETQLISAEKRIIELEQQLTLVDLKCIDADRERENLHEKTTELTTLLRGIEEENAISKCQFQAYDDRISQLESSLNISYLRNSQLEQELKGLAEKCEEHEGRASATHQRRLELEELVHISDSKAEDAGNKAGELELLLEAASYQNKEIEQLLSNTEAKYREAEAESKQHNSKVSELSAELEAFQTKSASLEAVLQAASEKERELTDMLNVVIEERQKFEEMLNSTGEKLLKAESLIEILQNELQSEREKLENVERDLEASGVRENEILGKLKSAEEHVEHHLRAVEHADTRSLELEKLHESSIKDSELKLHEAVVNFSQRDSEAKQLHEKLRSLEEQSSFHQGQAGEATEKVATLKEELEASAIKLVALENTIEELKRKIAETEVKAEQSIFDNELLAGVNSKLREELVAHQCKANDLHELLSSIEAEKEATAEQLAFHVSSMSKLTDEHSRGLELQSATESRIKETEIQLHEAIERFTQRDSEAQDLNEKLLSLEAQLRIYEEQVSEATSVAENHKAEREDALQKLQKLEGLVEEIRSKATQFETENEGLAREYQSLSQELVALDRKMNESQMALNAVIVEKEAISVQLQASRKETEDLMQQLSSDGEKLQSQISSVMEENNTLNEMHQDTKKELQAVIVQMEEKINEQKAREISLNADVEHLKAELSEKSLMQAQISELEQQLMLAETKYKEEIESMRIAADEKETVLTSKLEEHASVLHERDVLDEQSKELEKELKLAQTTLAQQKELVSRMELERDATVSQSLGEVETKHQHVILLETQVEELKQKLQIAEEQYKEKDIEEGKKRALVNAELDNLKLKLSQTVELEKKITELENKLQLVNAKSREQEKDEIMEVKTRDFSVDADSVSKRKSKKKSAGVHQTTEATATAYPAATTPAAEPSGPMAFKFILGVALVSVIIGVLIGKRY